MNPAIENFDAVRKPVPLVWFSCIYAALCLLAPFSQVARADTFVLRTGGELQGVWTNRTKGPIKSYNVRTNSGVELILDTDAVREVRPGLSDSQFQKLAAGYKETADAQWELACHCRKQGWNIRYRETLERVVALDADHEAARRALGHHWMKGKWVDPDEQRLREGYVRHKGAWAPTQQVALDRQREENTVRVRVWQQRLKQLRHRIQEGERAAAPALAEIRKITDPAAIPGLFELYTKETSLPLQSAYVQTIVKTQSPMRLHPLCRICMMPQTGYDAFFTATDDLKRVKAESVTAYFVKRLGSNDNDTVNRAALALGELADATAISPLIDALITRHWRIKRGMPVKARDEILPLLTSDGGPPAFEMQKRLEHLEFYDVQNSRVLDALVELAGDQGFGYRKAQWRQWHNALLNIRVKKSTIQRETPREEWR